MTSSPAQHDALTIYLNDHLAAMTGSVELAKRAAGRLVARSTKQTAVVERLRRQAAATALGGTI